MSVVSGLGSLWKRVGRVGFPPFQSWTQPLLARGHNPAEQNSLTLQGIGRSFLKRQRHKTRAPGTLRTSESLQIFAHPVR
jgi:hypothetical protein